MHHEYPKWIYPDGDVARGFIVQDADEEAAVETEIDADGTTATGTAPLPGEAPAPKRKYTRKA